MPPGMLSKMLSEFGLTEVYFGPSGFRIHAGGDLQEAQLGYARHPNGSDLTGVSEGEWRKEWIVIGQNIELGDPYFVDTSEESLPVHTAAHGIGTWEPTIVSPSLRNFLSCLTLLHSRFKQEDSLLEPNELTLRQNGKVEALKKELILLNGDSGFWDIFFHVYKEWLEENDS